MCVVARTYDGIKKKKLFEKTRPKGKTTGARMERSRRYSVKTKQKNRNIIFFVRSVIRKSNVPT